MIRAVTLYALFAIVSTATLSAQYERTILIEDFSSVTCVNCPQASAIVTKLVKENEERAISIQYHLDIPGRNDPFYAMNKPHQDARAAYYGGFNALPQVFVDGRSVSGTNEAEVRSEVNFQKGEESPILITVTQSFEGGALKANVSVTADEALSDGYRLYVVAAEKLVERTREYFTDTAKSLGYYNETIFHDLFRTFATPAAGETISLTAGQTKNFSYTVPLGERWAPGEMFVVAWVQDEFNNEVVQTGFSQPTNGVEEESRVEGYDIVSVSPNPTGSDLSLELMMAAPQDVSVEIYDVAGNQVARFEQGRMEAGQSTIDLTTDDLPAGSYLVRVSAGEFTASQTVPVGQASGPPQVGSQTHWPQVSPEVLQVVPCGQPPPHEMSQTHRPVSGSHTCPAPQSPHWPCQWVVEAPQSEQT